MATRGLASLTVYSKTIGHRMSQRSYAVTDHMAVLPNMRALSDLRGLYDGVLLDHHVVADRHRNVRDLTLRELLLGWTDHRAASDHAVAAELDRAEVAANHRLGLDDRLAFHADVVAAAEDTLLRHLVVALRRGERMAGIYTEQESHRGHQRRGSGEARAHPTAVCCSTG